MKAQELLRRYATGERDFRNANLRGANFRGQDLSGANFSGADIRSASFNNATLQGVNFEKVQTGLQRRWAFVQWTLVAVISGVAGILQGFSGGLVPMLFQGRGDSSTVGVVYISFLSIVYLLILLRGFTVRAFGTVLTLLAILFGSIFLYSLINAVFVGSSAFSSSGTVAFGGAFGVVGIFAVTSTVLFLGSLASISVPVAITAGLFAVSIAIICAQAFANSTALAVAILSTVPSFLLSFYVGAQGRQESDRFIAINELGLIVLSWGGTSFSGADLTSTNFACTSLKSTNFNDSSQHLTNLTHVYWQGSHSLNQARLGSSILRDRRVRILLTTPEKGYKQDLSNANLRGANLSGLTLEKANLTRATLSNAHIHKTMLEGATLTEVQAVGADFTGAYLTGAKLEGWNIDSTTVLKDIDCRYVFLLEKLNKDGDQERRPHDPTKFFQPGDFEKFFKEMLDEVQILIRGGIHPTAFRAAFQSIMQQNPDITPDAIKGYEKRGTDVMLTLQVPEGTNKAELEHAWEEGYQTGLKAGKDAERLESVDFLKQTLLLSAGQSNTFVNENKLMTGNDQRQNIDVKGNFTVTANNSVVSFRDISGQVNNQIDQLSNEPTQTQLKDLLTQLQTAIEAEPALNEEQKTEALEEVKELAAAGQAPQDGPMKKAAKRAITVLKGMTVGLGETTKFVEACNGLLPAISILFGL